MSNKSILRPNEQPLPRYAIHRLIGKGGLGEVHFAISDAGKEVALKLFTGACGVHRGARTILNLSHPNLVHLYDLVTDDKGREWLVMEYVHGASLDRLMNNRPLPLADARAYFADMAEAVAYLHDHNVMHRDLKPANLLLPRGTGRLKVVDFDLCRRVEHTAGHTTRIGTPQYMAPELSSGKYDIRVDIYAAGLILAEMLTGRPVFGDPDKPVEMQHQVDAPDLSGVPTERLRRVIAKALDKDKDNRYATMGEMAAEADAAFAELVSARPVPVAPPVPVARRAEAETLPFARPAPVTGTRHAVAGLLGGMLAAPVVVAVACVPAWLLLSGTDWPLLMRLLVTGTAVSWAALLAGIGVKARERVRWDRRFLLAVFGVGVGLLAYWMDGWPTPRLTGADPPGAAESYLFGLVRVPAGTFGVELRYLFYFGLAMLGPRWWRGAATDRADRFSLLPILEATAWGAALLPLWPWAGGWPVAGLAPLALAALAIQTVTAWVPVVTAQPPRKKRLRAVA